MKRIQDKKWLAVGVIWGVVVVMTGWNIHLINQIQSQRRELEVMRMDLRFLNANGPAIQEMRRQHSRLTHPVHSFGLGFVVVENDLKRLSSNVGLEQLRVEADKNFQDGRSVPISIFATGPLPAIVEWIAAVEDGYPYLVIERMHISYDHQDRQGILQATFIYHFTLSDGESTG